jgi:hypothetical protein
MVADRRFSGAVSPKKSLIQDAIRHYRLSLGQEPSVDPST